jgi:peptidoglycan hydrolase CwlO-like protein
MNWEKKFTKWIGSTSSVITHTILFAIMLALPLFGIHFDTVLLILTTVVSLEAIYLAIFIQMSVNENTISLHEVEENIDEIQEDVDEIQENVDEIQEDVGEIQQDMDEISIDIEDFESGLEEIQAVAEDNLGQEVDELDNIKNMLNQALFEIERLKKNN